MSLSDLTPTPVTLPNDTVLNYVRAGTGPTVIFIHGAMGDWRSWSPQWDMFTACFDCISYSRRYSHPNPNRMEARNHNALVDAEDLEGLMDALAVDRGILIGSSYGGFTALAMAVRAPDRVSAVVAVEAPMMRYAYRSEDGTRIADAFRTNTVEPARKAFERGHDAEGARILTGGIVGRRPADVPAAVMERRMQNIEAARSLSLSNDEFPIIEPDCLCALPMPVLLISGAETAPVHAAIFKEVVKMMPNARTRIVQGSGHSVSQQQAETFNADVFDFLAESGLLHKRRFA